MSSKKSSKPAAKGRRSAKELIQNSTSSKGSQHQDSNSDASPDIESETCIICAEPLQVLALSPCKHAVCHVCAFRQRSLYEKTQCLVCRTENEKLIFTDNIKLQDFNEVKETELLPPFEGDLGISYTSEASKKLTLFLLEYICPIKSCDFHKTPFNSFKELNEHVKTSHNKFYCTICGNNKKAFPSELSLYTQNKLQLHIKKGDFDGFNGHPSCKFCKSATFYSDDELFVHLRQKHEKCHVCDSINPNNPQYFKDYNQLENHFRDTHFICNVRSCLDQKFVVFPDEFELQAHMAKEHPHLTDGRLNFGHQLSSAFNNNTKKITNNNEKTEPKTSYATKKKRLEMRAKHYLNFDEDLYERFDEANSQFSNGHIDARELQNVYKEVFKRGVHADVSLLLYEFSELFPASSPERKELADVNKFNLKTKQLQESFPELPGSDSRTNSILTTPDVNWINNPNLNSRIKSGTEKFPSLPTTKTKTVGGAWGSTRTTKKPIARGISLNQPKNGQCIPGYAPVGTSLPVSKPMSSYQAVLSNNSSSTSLPTLTPKSVARTSSASSLSSNNGIGSASWGAAPSAPSTIRKTNSSMFPSLPKPKPKTIPPLQSSSIGKNQWGSNTSLSSSNANSSSTDGLDELFASGLNIKVKQGKNKKKKQPASVSAMFD